MYLATMAKIAETYQIISSPVYINDFKAGTIYELPQQMENIASLITKVATKPLHINP